MAVKTKDEKYYQVVSAFTDAVTGDEVLPGSIFKADDKRARKLLAAEVIGDEAIDEQIAELEKSDDNVKQDIDKQDDSNKAGSKGKSGGDKDADNT